MKLSAALLLSFLGFISIQSMDKPDSGLSTSPRKQLSKLTKRLSGKFNKSVQSPERTISPEHEKFGHCNKEVIELTTAIDWEQRAIECLQDHNSEKFKEALSHIENPQVKEQLNLKFTRFERTIQGKRFPKYNGSSVKPKP